MTPIQEGFLREVFKETNGHIRATDRKSLIVTGVYVGLFSVFLATLPSPAAAAKPEAVGWSTIGVQAFFLLVGTMVFVLQQWYRAWKEHYVCVTHRLCELFLGPVGGGVFQETVPVWMRVEDLSSRLSIDNLFQYLTVFINSIIVCLLSLEILELLARSNVAILTVVVGVIAYVTVVSWTWRYIRKNKLSRA